MTRVRSSRLLISSVAAVCSIWVLAGGCSSSDDAPNSTGGPDFDPSDAAGDSTVVMPDGGNVEAGGGSSIDPLCGQGTCNPDEASACQDFDPGIGGAPAVTPPPEPPAASGGSDALPANDGGAAGAVGHGGLSAGGQSGEGNGVGAAGMGGAGNASGEGGAAGAGGQSSQARAQGGEAGSAGESNGNGPGLGGASAAGAGSSGAPGAPSPSFSCQVTLVGRNAVRECAAAGTGRAKAPCISAADCASGFACVTEGEAGRCVAYCCGGDAQCTSGEYCAPREVLRSSSAERRHDVPVCVPADDCSLNEPYPCPAGNDCRCPAGKACMVVRAGGTTTCLTPGSGTQGGACPCAWGHVCSSATNRCVKICSTSSGSADCGAQKCQASSELPQGFGVCVGSAR